jgi:hypothetical protein
MKQKCNGPANATKQCCNGNDQAVMAANKDACGINRDEFLSGADDNNGP